MNDAFMMRMSDVGTVSRLLNTFLRREKKRTLREHKSIKRAMKIEDDSKIRTQFNGLKLALFTYGVRSFYFLAMLHGSFLPQYFLRLKSILEARPSEFPQLRVTKMCFWAKKWAVN